MSELMIPIPFRELMNWLTAEYEREGSVFGVHRPYFAGRSPCPSSAGRRSRPPSAPPPGPTPSWPRTSSPPTSPGPGFLS